MIDLYMDERNKNKVAAQTKMTAQTRVNPYIMLRSG